MPAQGAVLPVKLIIIRQYCIETCFACTLLFTSYVAELLSELERPADCALLL